MAEIHRQLAELQRRISQAASSAACARRRFRFQGSLGTHRATRAIKRPKSLINRFNAPGSAAIRSMV
ncbi:hypothetical protein [Paracoccus aminovorans]|uniref:hypothetical protein n=1 Tax=Paracoccus aminovorans TaxID=34004 RepID=UPI00396F2A94